MYLKMPPALTAAAFAAPPGTPQFDDNESCASFQETPPVPADSRSSSTRDDAGRVPSGHGVSTNTAPGTPRLEQECVGSPSLNPFTVRQPPLHAHGGGDNDMVRPALAARCLPFVKQRRTLIDDGATRIATADEAQVVCPLCNDRFEVDIVERHAAQCTGIALPVTVAAEQKGSTVARKDDEFWAPERVKLKHVSPRADDADDADDDFVVMKGPRLLQSKIVPLKRSTVAFCGSSSGTCAAPVARKLSSTSSAGGFQSVHDSFVTGQSNLATATTSETASKSKLRALRLPPPEAVKVPSPPRDPFGDLDDIERDPNYRSTTSSDKDDKRQQCPLCQQWFAAKDIERHVNEELNQQLAGDSQPRPSAATNGPSFYDKLMPPTSTAAAKTNAASRISSSSSATLPPSNKRPSFYDKLNTARATATVSSAMSMSKPPAATTASATRLRWDDDDVENISQRCVPQPSNIVRPTTTTTAAKRQQPPAETIDDILTDEENPFEAPSPRHGKGKGRVHDFDDPIFSCTFAQHIPSAIPPSSERDQEDENGYDEGEYGDDDYAYNTNDCEEDDGPTSRMVLPPLAECHSRNATASPRRQPQQAIYQPGQSLYDSEDDLSPLEGYVDLNELRRRNALPPDMQGFFRQFDENTSVQPIAPTAVMTSASSNNARGRGVRGRGGRGGAIFRRKGGQWRRGGGGGAKRRK